MLHALDRDAGFLEVAVICMISGFLLLVSERGILPGYSLKHYRRPRRRPFWHDHF